jgi:hypothetical protein
MMGFEIDMDPRKTNAGRIMRVLNQRIKKWIRCRT